MATAQSEESTTSTSQPEIKLSSDDTKNRPICIIVLGMAGSGKTSFVQRLAVQAFESHRPYVVNLDPACKDVPYNLNIDIRDTIDYKEVMKQYKLGPNGGIVTALNLFSTKFPDVVSLIEKSPKYHKYCVFDTPGQIEVFTWSVSGTIITETLASTFPTIVLYIMDTVRSVSPITFMSNMLYACSILYRTRLPFIIVMNKTDVVSPAYALEWINDFEAFQEALSNDENYISNLTRSMALTLDDFYKGLKVATVSSATGDGFEDLHTLIAEAAEEYEKEYKVEYEKLQSEKMNIKKTTKPKNNEESNQQHLVNEVAQSREFADIYLRHPANESSDDDEGTEVTPQEQEDEETFQVFVNKQKEARAEKIQNEAGPSKC